MKLTRVSAGGGEEDKRPSSGQLTFGDQGVEEEPVEKTGQELPARWQVKEERPVFLLLSAKNVSKDFVSNVCS